MTLTIFDEVLVILVSNGSARFSNGHASKATPFRVVICALATFSCHFWHAYALCRLSVFLTPGSPLQTLYPGPPILCAKRHLDLSSHFRTAYLADKFSVSPQCLLSIRQAVGDFVKI